MTDAGAHGEEIDALIRNGNRTAVLRLLDNPRITSHHVQTILKDRRTSASFPMALSRIQRWMAEEPIRVLFRKYPNTPLPDALARLKTLPLSRVRFFERSPGVRPQIRTAAQEIVKRKARGLG